jgi:glucokinase
MNGDRITAAPGTRHVGLDLGATNLKWCVVEHAGGDWRRLADGQVPTRVAAETDLVPAAVTAQLAEVAVGAIAAWGPVASVGIGIPGLYDPAAGTTRFLVNLSGPWAEHPVAGPVAEAVGVPVFLINDARAFGLAELRLGAGRGASSMVGLTLGTGVGGVFAVDGRVHLGHDGTGGEIGHQTIDPDGPWCNCGNRGCLEAYARADQIAAACGTSTAEEAVRAAKAGDARARAGLADVGRYLGIGIANMITVISPDRVVLGGGVAAAGELLLAPIRAEIARRVTMTSLDEVALVTAELGTLAGAIGAAVHGAEQEAAARTATEAGVQGEARS